MKEKLKKAHIVHEGSFINVHEDDVILADNRIGKRLYIKHPGGSGVLAITPDNKVVMVKQYRYAIDRYIVEIPAGKHDNQDDPIITAKRELAEETGYASDDFTLLTTIYPTPGYSDEIITIYLAKNVYLLTEKIKGDDDEFITVMLYNKEEVQTLLSSNEIMDSKTLIALQMYLNM